MLPNLKYLSDSKTTLIYISSVSKKKPTNNKKKPKKPNPKRLVFARGGPTAPPVPVPPPHHRCGLQQQEILPVSHSHEDRAPLARGGGRDPGPGGLGRMTTRILGFNCPPPKSWIHTHTPQSREKRGGGGTTS